MIKGIDNKSMKSNPNPTQKVAQVEISKPISGFGSEKREWKGEGATVFLNHKVKAEKPAKPEKIEKPKAEKPAKPEKPVKIEKPKAEIKSPVIKSDRPTLKEFLKSIEAQNMTREEVNAKIKKDCEEKGWQVWSRVLVKAAFEAIKEGK